MTEIDQNIYATDLDDDDTNCRLTGQGFTIRRIETWQRSGHSDAIIIWDAPRISAADLPY